MYSLKKAALPQVDYALLDAVVMFFQRQLRFPFDAFDFETVGTIEVIVFQDVADLQEVNASRFAQSGEIPVLEFAVGILEVHVFDPGDDLVQGLQDIRVLVVVIDVACVEVEPQVGVIQVLHGAEHPGCIDADAGMCFEAVGDALFACVIADFTEVLVEGVTIRFLFDFSCAAYNEFDTQLMSEVELSFRLGDDFRIEGIAGGNVAAREFHMVLFQQIFDVRDILSGGGFREQRSLFEERGDAVVFDVEFEVIDSGIADVFDRGDGTKATVGVGQAGNEGGHAFDFLYQ